MVSSLLKCECGALGLTDDGYCVACGADRCKGFGEKLAQDFLERYERLPSRERPAAKARIEEWLR